MTDTAKPTLWTLEDAAMAAFHGGSSSTWRQTLQEIFSDNTLFISSICKQMDDREDQKQKLLDERNQLQDRVRELENALDAALNWLVPPIARHIDHEDSEDNDPIYQQVVGAMRAAIAKHGEGV